MQLQLRGLNFPIQSRTKPSLTCVVMFLSSLLSSSLSPDPTSIFQGRENIKVSLTVTKPVRSRGCLQLALIATHCLEMRKETK